MSINMVFQIPLGRPTRLERGADTVLVKMMRLLLVLPLALGAPDLREEQKRDHDGLIDSTSANFHATVKVGRSGPHVDFDAQAAREAVREQQGAELRGALAAGDAKRTKRADPSDEEAPPSASANTNADGYQKLGA